MVDQIRNKVTAQEIHLLRFWQADVRYVGIYACLDRGPSATEAFYNRREEQEPITMLAEG